MGDVLGWTLVVVLYAFIAGGTVYSVALVWPLARDEWKAWRKSRVGGISTGDQT